MADNVVDMQNPGDSLVAAIQASIAAAEHLEDTDEGAINLALKFAQTIEDLTDKGGEEANKIFYGPAASLEKILGNLGLTPAGRASLDLDQEEEETDEF